MSDSIFSGVVNDAFHKQRLDQARGLHQLLKDQMMTGDVPTTVDGPASGRKRKKKGPGDCGPNGAHVAKGQVLGYTRVTPSGKVIHVSGYSRADGDRIAAIDLESRAADPADKKINFYHPKVGENHEFVLPGGGGRFSGKVIEDMGDGRVRVKNANGNVMRLPVKNLRAGKKSTPKFQVENVDPKKGPTDEQKKRHAAEMGGRSAESPAAVMRLKDGETAEYNGLTIARQAEDGGGSSWTVRRGNVDLESFTGAASAVAWASKDHDYGPAAKKPRK